MKFRKLLAVFIIAAGGAFTAAALDLAPNQDIGDIRTVTWVVIAVTGITAAAKESLETLSAKTFGARTQLGGFGVAFLVVFVYALLLAFAR